MNYRWTVTPNVVNEFVAGFNRFTFSFNNPDPRENPPVILNVPNDPLNLEEPVNNLRTITTWQFVDNISVIHNAHAFKFGTNLRFQKHVDDRSAVAGVLTRARIFLGTAQNPVPATFRTQARQTRSFPASTHADRTSTRQRYQRSAGSRRHDQPGLRRD